MDNSNSNSKSSSTPVSDSSSTSTPSSSKKEQNSSSTQPGTSPKNVGGDQKNATKKTEVVKENKVISAS